MTCLTKGCCLLNLHLTQLSVLESREVYRWVDAQAILLSLWEIENFIFLTQNVIIFGVEIHSYVGGDRYWGQCFSLRQ